MDGSDSQEPNIQEDLAWMAKLTPVFGINGNNVKVIHEPTEFYDILKEQARRAQKRIVLASLYLGTGIREKELVAVIQDSMRQSVKNNDSLQVEVLLDFTRGSRGENNSRTMLLPLLKEFNEQVQVSLYHSPDLRGWLKWALPERWNEIIGLSHLKVYLFDDNLIMSGANLSESYFTNRQDRYILIENSPELADFFQKLVQGVSGLSFHLRKDDTLVLAPGVENHPFEDTDDGSRFRAEASQRLQTLLGSNKDVTRASSSDPAEAASVNKQGVIPTQSTKCNVDSKEVDTWVYPLIQMPQFNIRIDEIITQQFFKRAVKDSCINLGSGYFNLTDQYIETIVQDSKASYKILSAAPEANGFYNGAGISGSIPDAYTYIAKQFTEKVNSQKQEERISLHEYSRSGWTFHAKGLWHYLPNHSLPYLTFIGSSNFGYRSVYRDLEAQLVIATRNRNLQKQLHQEQLRLFASSKQAKMQTFRKPIRHVPMWVTYVTNVIRKFF